MQRNIKCLIQACQNLHILYQFIDKEENFVQLNFNNHTAYFRISVTPFNSDIHSEICKDKMHSYTLLNSLVRMPKTIQFLDYNTEEKYKKYLEYPSEDAILNAIDQNFNYPLVIKKNKGSLGIHVHLCSNQKETRNALQRIFNQASKSYDYVALAQEFIPTQEEYRLLCVYGKPALAYFRGNASDFNQQYWEKGEVATLITEQSLITKLYQLVQPVFSVFDIPWVGFDIIKGKDQQLYLIELNSTPRFEHIMESSGEELIIQIYEIALREFCAKNKIDF